MYEDYLAHYGIPGMKWGVRRYQPYSVRGRISGKSGREVGEAKKLSKEERKARNKQMVDKALTQNIKGGKDKPNVSPAEQIFKKTNDISENAARINRVVQKKKNLNMPRESKQLSDAELRKRIDRLNLEKQYEQLSNEDIEKGKMTTKDLLDTIGAVTSIAASVAAIAATIYQIKHSDFLAHHGIKGQKWGQRNGPPYPLNPSDKSTAEKKAEGGSGSGNSKVDAFIKKYQNRQAGMIDPVTATYLTIAAAYVAVYAALVIKNNMDYKKDLKEHMDSDVGDIQKRIKGKHTPEQDAAEINKGYSDPDNLGARMNCTLCSTAYDLRRRGYDVKARETKRGRRPEDVARFYNISKKDIPEYDNYDSFVEALRSEPDGARGLTFTGYGFFDSHHSVAWEKQNGRIIIRDTQCNENFNSVAESGIRPGSMIPYKYIRTDDKEINLDYVKDAVEERKD